MRKKIKRNTAFLHILKVGNDTGQLLKHSFKSLPGVQVHIVAPHQQIIRADVKIYCKRNQQIQRWSSCAALYFSQLVCTDIMRFDSNAFNALESLAIVFRHSDI